MNAVAYETIASEETEIKKKTGKGVRVYRYTQLKGYKYRACRHLKKALEYLMVGKELY